MIWILTSSANTGREYWVRVLGASTRREYWARILGANIGREYWARILLPPRGILKTLKKLPGREPTAIVVSQYNRLRG